jgi:hypothetical protein
MNTRKSLLLVIVALVMSLIITACGAGSIFAPTPTPYPMVGCNAILMEEGTLGFDESYQGAPYTISADSPYVSQRFFFDYYRADCIQGYPRVVMALADIHCLNQEVRWEADGGWSCWMPDGSWTFKVGGIYYWPRGKPEGMVDPAPIFPDFPLVPPGEGQAS